MKELTATVPAANQPYRATTPRAPASDRRPALLLALIVVASAVVRGIVAVKHAAPHYFPDEYVYAALGRSIAHGHLQVRGHASHFPAILEPLVAAPLWRFFSTTTAYHAIQLENAVFLSLAAIPTYYMARWLRLGTGYSLACAAFALLLPELTLAGFVVSDLVAYPLILTTVFVGVRTIETPSARRQLAFLALASLSTLARVEYSVVVVAYIVAAVLVERRRVLRTHWLAAIAIIPAAAAIVVGAAGYYLVKGAGTLELHPLPLLHWFFLQAFLLTIATGVVIVPGAVAAWLRPQGVRETIHAAFTGSFVLLILAAATEPAAATTRFKERYLFALLPLISLSFGVYLRRRPLRLVVIGIAAAVAIALAKIPLSGYAASIFKGDSEFLWGVWFLERHLGTQTGSLVVALIATAGCLLAAAVAFWRLTLTSIAALFAFVGVFAAFSIVEDLKAGNAIRAVLPKDLTWIDDAAKSDVTAVATTRGPSNQLRELLFWNISVGHEVVLPGATPTDVFSAPVVHVRPDGTLPGVRGTVLFDETGAIGAFMHAKLLTSYSGYTLWRPSGAPRFRLLIDDRYWDGWLGDGGSIRAWPVAKHRAVKLSFSVSLPADWKRVRLKLGGTTVVIPPGTSRRVTCRSASGPLNVPYSSPDALYDLSFRHVIARLTNLDIEDVAMSRTRGQTCSTRG